MFGFRLKKSLLRAYGKYIKLWGPSIPNKPYQKITPKLLFDKVQILLETDGI